MPAARPTTGSASDRGRRRHNADALAVHAQGGGLGVAVADGIGDNAAAVEAAHVAANAAAWAAASSSALDAVLAAREALTGRGDAVLVVAALRQGRGEIAWVGDCRAYLYDGTQVVQLTSDQTMAEAVRDAGATPPPRWEHVVTESVRTASEATVGRAELPGVLGRLALVTDGVHRELSTSEVAAILGNTRDVAIAARELTDLALLAGGGDNASATVVEVPLVVALPQQHTDTGPTFPAVTPAAEPA